MVRNENITNTPIDTKKKTRHIPLSTMQPAPNHCYIHIADHHKPTLLATTVTLPTTITLHPNIVIVDSPNFSPRLPSGDDL